MSVEQKAFDTPDDVVAFDHGRVELVKVGSITVGRETLEPGWRWSQHVRPIVGTEWCEFAHVMYVLSGQARVVTRDGQSRDIAPGEVVAIDPGHDAWVLGAEPVVSIDIQGVVGWARPPDPGERVLATILFTDIVESTVVAERMGDQAWKRLLASHEEDILALLAQHRGRLVKTTGDGFVGTFDAPARAIRCALDLVAAAERLGVAIRAGIHTGEVEFADDDLRGIAVHFAARVMGMAEPGTVYVSATTRELAIGAALEFVDQGTRVLKGITGERQLFEARMMRTAPGGQ